jgi:hypothetical protein
MLIRQVLAIPGNVALASLALACAFVSVTCLWAAYRALQRDARVRPAFRT